MRSTQPQFGVRVAEHKGRSARTSTSLLSAKNSSIFNYKMNNNHPVKEVNSQIIKSFHNNFDLRIPALFSLMRSSWMVE